MVLTAKPRRYKMATQSRENLVLQFADYLAGATFRTKEWHEKLIQERENEDPEITRQRKEWRRKIHAEALERNEMVWQVLVRHRREQAEKEQRETQTEPQS